MFLFSWLLSEAPGHVLVEAQLLLGRQGHGGGDVGGLRPREGAVQGGVQGGVYHQSRRIRGDEVGLAKETNYKECQIIRFCALRVGSIHILFIIYFILNSETFILNGENVLFN